MNERTAVATNTPTTSHPGVADALSPNTRGHHSTVAPQLYSPARESDLTREERDFDPARYDRDADLEADGESTPYDVDEDKKKLWVAYLLALPPFGIFGAHNYYLGRRRMGIIYSATAGLCLYGWVVDLFRMYWLVKRVNNLVNTEKDPYYVDDAYLTWFPLGLFGLHRFYLGSYKLGLAQMFTLCFCIAGWLVEACLLRGAASAAELKRNEFGDQSGAVATNGMPTLSQGTFRRVSDHSSRALGTDVYTITTPAPRYSSASVLPELAPAPPYPGSHTEAPSAPACPGDSHIPPESTRSAPPTYPGTPGHQTQILDFGSAQCDATSARFTDELPEALNISEPTSELEHLPPPPSYHSLFSS